MRNKQFLADWKTLILLTVPMIVASLSEIVLSTVDTIFIGKLGVEQLASVGIAIAVYTIIVQLLGATAIGYQIIASREFGSDNRQSVATKLYHSIIFLLILAILSIILLFFSRVILSVMTKDAVVIEEALIYLKYRAPSLIFFVGIILLKMTFDANRLSKYGMYTLIIVNTFNIILNYFLIFGIGIFPEMGVAGAALGSSISTVVGFIFISILFLKKKIIPLTKISWNWNELKSILKISGPEMANGLLDYFGNLLFVMIIGLLGITALAGGRISFILIIVIFIISLNFGIGIQILMGQYLGKNDHITMERILRNGRLLSLIILSVVGIVLSFWPEQILRLFTPFEDIISDTTGAVIIIGLCTPLIAWTTSHMGALRAFGKTKMVMYTNLIAIWFIQLPIAWIMGFYLNLGLTGIYISYLFYFLSRALISHYLVYKLLKKYTLTVEKEVLINDTI